MRLKKIEVLGFKSFADRQMVLVDDHVTGVIGPNGCGKSNIVDAIRWCMGEQSAKHLRGTGMADVIFAGCASRGPAGMAEVTLTLDNQRDALGQSGQLLGEVPAPHFDHPEIAITRRLYADGTSEYLINKVPARLRDITELLMGTGAGTKGYSIIEQGQVGRIVSSKPEERRHIIDEAAGITRFKAQKAAAQKKIEATRQNLLRVHDVIAELEGRLTTLRRQAQKAERYKRYREELRDLELWIAAHRYLEQQSTGSVLDGRRADLHQQVEDLRTALQARESQIQLQRKHASGLEAELQERSQALVEVENRIRLLEAEEEYRQRERQGAAQTVAQATAELEVARRNLEGLRTEHAETLARRTALGDAEGPQGRRSVLEQCRIDLEATEASIAGHRRELERARSEQADRGSQLAGAEARLQSHGETLIGLDATVAELEAALHERRERCEALQQGQEAAEAAVAEAAASVEALRAQRKTLDRRRAELKELVASAEVELDTKRAEVHRCRSRLQSLEEIQRRYRGCHSGVQVVMEHRAALEASASLGAGGAVSGGSTEVVHGILADYVHAPEHLEPAVSAILGDRLEGVVVDAPSVGARGVELLKEKQEGRTTFLPRHGRVESAAPAGSERSAPIGWAAPSGPSRFEFVDLSDRPSQASQGDTTPDADTNAALLDAPGVIGRLADLVEVSGELGPLTKAMLGEAVVVDGLHRALELWEQHRTAATLVTLDGDRVEPTGVVVGGSPTALNSALLQQKREIRELQEILESLGESFDNARGRHQLLAEELAAVEGGRETNEAEVLTAETARVGRQGAWDQLRNDLAQLREQVQRDAQELERRQADAAQRRLEIERLQHEVVAHRERIEALATALGDHERGLSELGEQREARSTALTEAKIALAQWQQQVDALEQAADRLARQVDAEQLRIDRLGQTISTAEARIAELDAATVESERARNELGEQRTALRVDVDERKQAYDAIKSELEEIEGSVTTLRNDLDERRERLQEVELGLQEIELERQHLLADARDRFDLDLLEVLIDYHDRPLAKEPELARQRELKQVLARMGEVNLTAIEEFEEVSQRHTYLSGQRNDLEQAIAQLQEAIDRINKTTKDLFRDTFNAVNERFQLLFPRLFGGGSASLKLTEPGDLLTTGVEIEARPPGKQPRTLDLLSGGEKALTAVSLIFAIFLIKPSPFCLLDEVDAPLDDANVARFCNLVRELAGSTQFIIITHNKVTMETADRLYGVTMEQRGVSKLVSVNMRRAIELAYN